MSSSSDDDCSSNQCRNIKKKRKSPKCYEAVRFRVGDLIVTGCLSYQGEEADPYWIRGPIITTSTITGSTNVNLNTGTLIITPAVNSALTTNNVNLGAVNAFIPSPPLPFPSGTQIPQGVFATNTAPFFGSRMPNFVNIMETQNISQIETWKCAREIRSKIYLQNISAFNTYNVGFVLIGYSYNGYIENLQMLDMDVQTMTPGSYATFKVKWQTGNSVLPFQSDAIQVVIQTSVLLVNQVFTQQALADLVTFNFSTNSLKLKIILVY